MLEAFKGAIDDVGLFSKALTEDDIKIIMNQGLEEACMLTAVSSVDKLTTTLAGIKAQK
jgi:hypothetical protein